MTTKFFKLFALFCMMFFAATCAVAATSTPITLHGGFTTSLKLAGKSPKLYNRMYYDRELTRKIPPEKMMSFLVGDVVWLDESVKPTSLERKVCNETLKTATSLPGSVEKTEKKIIHITEPNATPKEDVYNLTTASYKIDGWKNGEVESITYPGKTAHTEWINRPIALGELNAQCTARRRVFPQNGKIVIPSSPINIILAIGPWEQKCSGDWIIVPQPFEHPPRRRNWLQTIAAIITDRL